MTYSSSNRTKRITTIGILSALGAVLMLIEIPYPFVPFLTFDLSDVVVLVIFMIYGWKEAAAVGILKALVHLLFKAPVGPAGIGQITAFLASMSYVLGMFVAYRKLKLNRFVSTLITVGVVTVIMTVLNYLFITPIWFGGLTFADVNTWVTPESFGLGISGGYLKAIMMVYIPFNLLKGILITGSFLGVYQVLKEYFEKA